MQVLIVTGMSGAGRSTVAHALEDLDWFVIDNLPPQFLGPLIEFTVSANDTVLRLAAVVDVRGRDLFSSFQELLPQLREKIALSILFLDASDDALVRRFESVRRPHPLQSNGGLVSAIQEERQRLSRLRALSDYEIDTSEMNVHQLTDTIRDHFATSDTPGLQLTVQSFGFKYGLPADADIVADGRFLPNPFWVDELKPLTGQDAPVRDYVLAQRGAAEFLESFQKTVRIVLEGYTRENKRQAMIAIGCTGGKHRSVALAEELARRLIDLAGVAVNVRHRDLGRE